MAEAGYPFGRWHDVRDELADGGESVLEDDTCNVASPLVGLDELDGYSTSQTLAVYDDVCVLELFVVSHEIKCSLTIDSQTLLTWCACGLAIASVFRHEAIAAHGFGYDLSDGYASWPNIASVTVEGKDGAVLLDGRI